MDLLDNLAPSLMIVGAAALLIPRLNPNGRLTRLVCASAIGLLLARYMIWRALYTLPAPESLVQAVASYGYFTH